MVNINPKTLGGRLEPAAVAIRGGRRVPSTCGVYITVCRLRVAVQRWTTLWETQWGQSDSRLEAVVAMLRRKVCCRDHSLPSAYNSALNKGLQARLYKIVTWLILPVVICLSQRLSHACLSISNYTVKLRMAH